MGLGQAIFMDSLQYAVAPMVRLWMMSLRWRIVCGFKDYETHKASGPVIWAFWHSNLLFPAYIGRDRGIRILISHHRDGEIVARVAKGLGLVPVRGSSSRGGTEALMSLAQAAGRYDIAITPDGPRGPREVVQPGVILLSQVTGRPIMPVAAMAHPSKRLGSWDRFILPMPGARASIGITKIIKVPPDANKETREEYRLMLEEELKRVTEIVENESRPVVKKRPSAGRHHFRTLYDKPWFTSP